MKRLRIRMCIRWSPALTMLALSLLPRTAQATAYTWTGANSAAWNLAANWTGGTFPNAAADQATINLGTNNPVLITTSITLGGATPSLTIGDSAAATALDIGSAGSLIMNATTGGIANNKIITLEGALNTNLGGATTRHYSIGGTGSLSLLGGTITGSSTRGYWDLNQPVNGYGTLNGRIFAFSTITANNATPITITGATFTLQGGTLAASGSGAYVNSGTITGFGHHRRSAHQQRDHLEQRRHPAGHLDHRRRYAGALRRGRSERRHAAECVHQQHHRPRQSDGRFRFPGPRQHRQQWPVQPQRAYDESGV